jgi:hypothetical protein
VIDGTAGPRAVTIEDLLEEIVGEIQDEYDREEAPIERVNATEAILDARVSIDALHELFGFEVDEEEQDYDTIGGFVYHHLGKVPVAGDEVRVDGLTLRVLSVLGRRIKKVRPRDRSSRRSAGGELARSCRDFRHLSRSCYSLVTSSPTRSARNRRGPEHTVFVRQRRGERCEAGPSATEPHQGVSLPGAHYRGHAHAGPRTPRHRHRYSP